MPIGINGTGSITGVTAGGYPDASVNVEDINAGTAAAGQKLIAGGATGAMTWGSSLAGGTSQASTSGTSLDFTGIPSWARRVTVAFVGISTNGTSPIIVQLGTSGGVETSNYLGTSGYIQSASQSLTSNLSSGVILVRDNAAVNLTHGSIVFSLVSSNTWAAMGVLANSNNAVPSMVAGSKQLAGTLDRVRITTVNGTDAFDAGSVNVYWE